MKKTDVSFGAYFNQFRRERQIPLAAALPDGISALSRFEQGHTQLSIERMHQVMARIGMMYSDLDEHFDVISSPFTKAAEAIIAERYAPKLSRIQSIVADYLLAVGEQSGRLALLNQAVFQVIDDTVAKHQTVMLAQQTQQNIQTLLEHNHQWLTYDYLLLRLAVSHLDSSNIVACIEMAQQRTKHAPAHYQGEYAQVVQQGVLVLLCRQQWDQAQELADQLAGIKPSAYWVQDMFTKNLLSQVLANLSDRSKLHVAVIELIDALDVMGLTDMQTYAEEVLQQMQGKPGVLV
jgi:hypothetical protein